jgi:hypothetical protein
MQGSGKNILSAMVEKGHKPEYRQLYFKASEMRNILGDGECFFEIRVRGKAIVKKYNPERQRHQYMVPSWVGEPGREVEVELKRLSDEEVVENMLKSLPDYLRLELKPDFKGAMHIHGVAFPVEASKPEWNERHNAVCMDIRFKALSLRGRKVKSHVLRVAYKGYETSMAINFGETKGTVKEIRGEPQGVVAISYVDTENRFFEHRIMPARATG